MVNARPRLIAAFLACAIWAGITLGVSLWQVGPGTSLEALVTERLVWATPLAALFMVAFVAVARWPKVGMCSPQPLVSLKVMWLPALYLIVFSAAILLLVKSGHAVPTTFALAMIALNTMVVGFSEELAFRGVLWDAARKALPFWPGFLLVSALFGMIHVMNALLTGAFEAAVVQAMNAFMLGCAFQALRIRNRSIWPVMILHWLWDCLIFILVTLDNDPAAAPKGAFFMPFVMNGPLFVYSLFLVRSERVRAGWRDDTLT